jgi:hypothetical protein
MTADGTTHMYWSSNKRWNLDNDVDSSTYTHAYISSEALTPPVGIHRMQWREYCGSGFNTVNSVTITELLTYENCAAEGERVFNLQTCNSVEQLREQSHDIVACAADCVDVWLSGLRRCSQRQRAFETGAPENFTLSCQDARTTKEAAVLALAGVSVSVSGLVCDSHLSGNNEYGLQPQTMNARAHYVTSDGGRHLYWSDGMWILDADNDVSAYSAYVNSDSSVVPSGIKAAWKEHCNSSWTYLPISITEQLSSSNCAARATAQLVHPDCSSATSSTCPTSCAEVWVVAADQCTSQEYAFDQVVPDGFTALCRDELEAALSTAAATIQVSGATCHDSANDEYILLPMIENGKVHYATKSGARHLYWTPRHGGYWILDSNDADNAYSAYFPSRSPMVPSGPRTWSETCSHAWAAVEISVTETLSASNCASSAMHIMEHPECQLSQMALANACSDTVTPSSTDNLCTLPCAELWLTALARCNSQWQLQQAFDSVAVEMTELCTLTMATALATAASSCTISGLTCHPSANAEYTVQSITINGRPSFVTEGGDSTLYWTPTVSAAGGPGWMLAGTDAYLLSPADIFPWAGGSAVKWGERCDNSGEPDGWVQAPVDVVPTFGKRGNSATWSRGLKDWCNSALSAMADQLTTLCCNQDGTNVCVDGQLPSVCTTDCASYFQSWLTPCKIQSLPSNFRQFAESCAAQSLVALVPTTVALQEGGVHDFGFEAEAGVRYVLIVRAEGIRATDIYVLPPGVLE